MKRWVLLLLAVMIALLAACSSRSTVEVKADGCIAPLSWGETFEAAETSLSEGRIPYEATESNGGLATIRLETTILGRSAEINALFNSDWPDTVPDGRYLSAITIRFAGTESPQIAEQLAKIWGAPVTTVPVYISADGVERIETREAEPQEGRDRWRSAQNLLDVKDIDRLPELLGFSEAELNEQSLLKRLYHSSLYSATLQQVEGEGCFLEINGYFAALDRLIGS